MPLSSLASLWEVWSCGLPRQPLLQPPITRCHHFSLPRNPFRGSPAHQGTFSQRSILEAARSTGEKPEAALCAAAAGRHKSPGGRGSECRAAPAVRRRGMGGHGSTQTG